jgi:hypothetical protein
MTQGTFATFDAAATPLGFAIGANFAMKFGNTLQGGYVSFMIASPSQTYQTLSSSTFTFLTLYCSLITLSGRVVNIACPNVNVDTTGAIDFSTPDQEIAFWSPNDPTVEQLANINFC